MELAGVDVADVEVDVAHEWWWGAFWELSGGRRWNDGMPMPLSWQDIAAWSEITGSPVDADDVSVLRAMDGAFMSWAADDAERRMKRNG